MVVITQTAVFKLTTVSKISNHLYKLFNIPVAPIALCSAGESWSMSGFRIPVQCPFRTQRLQLSTSDSSHVNR